MPPDGMKTPIIVDMSAGLCMESWGLGTAGLPMTAHGCSTCPLRRVLSLEWSLGSAVPIRAGNLFPWISQASQRLKHSLTTWFRVA